MNKKAEIMLDILIKKEQEHFLAHCLQFDLVTTADTLEEVREDILNLCRAHIEFSQVHDNLEYLFSPAPKEAWAEYLATSKKEECDVERTSLNGPPWMRPFKAQEIYCYA